LGYLDHHLAFQDFHQDRHFRDHFRDHFLDHSLGHLQREDLQREDLQKEDHPRPRPGGVSKTMRRMTLQVNGETLRTAGTNHHLQNVRIDQAVFQTIIRGRTNQQLQEARIRAGSMDGRVVVVPRHLRGEEKQEAGAAAVLPITPPPEPTLRLRVLILQHLRQRMERLIPRQ
jgi:hypothetical protein